LDSLATLPGGRKIILFGGVEDAPGKQGDINREIGRHMAEVADVVYCLGNQRSMGSLRASAVGAGMKSENVHIIGSELDGAMPVLARDLRPTT